MRPKTEKNPKGSGQTSKYELLHVADKLDAIAGWAMHGSTLKDIAVMLSTPGMSVNERSIDTWVGKYPEFALAVSKGRMVANGELLHSAFKKATGYDYIEEVLTKAGEIVALKKHAEPDTGMLCFMLRNKFAQGNTNLAPEVERFVDRQEISGPGGGAIPVTIKEVEVRLSGNTSSG